MSDLVLRWVFIGVATYFFVHTFIFVARLTGGYFG